MNFPKIWKSWLKNCARHAQFNFEFLKVVAVLFFKICPWNFDHLWIFNRQKMIFVSFSVSSKRKLKFEKSFFLFFWRAPKRYKKSWLWTIIYHLGATPEKKKQFFSNFSFPVEDTKKWIKQNIFVYEKSISDRNFKGISYRIGLPYPWEFKIEMGVLSAVFGP